MDGLGEGAGEGMAEGVLETEGVCAVAKPTRSSHEANRMHNGRRRRMFMIDAETVCRKEI